MAALPFTKPVEDSVPKVNNEVAVGEDLEFQRKWWRFEHGVWIFFTLILLLALAGVFGRGPVAKTHIQSPESAMKIGYDRIQRTGTPSVLTIEFDQPAVQDGKIHLYISESLVRQLNAQRVIPQPESTSVGEGGLTYTFPATVPPGKIEIAVQPSGPGLVPFEVRIPGGAALHSKILVLP